MREFKEQMRKEFNERDNKLQQIVGQMRGDMGKMEEKILSEVGQEVEIIKNGLEEKIQHVDMRVEAVAREQQDCNMAVQEVKTKQIELAVNVRDAMANQRHEVNQKIRQEVETLQVGLQQLESKTEEIGKKVESATLTVGEGKVVTLVNGDSRHNQANIGQKYKPKGTLHPMIFTKWLRGVFPVHYKDTDKIQFAIDRMEGEAFTWGVKKKEEIRDYNQFEREFLKKYWSESHQRAALDDLLYRKSLNKWKGTLREFAEHLWELNEMLERPVNDDIVISAVKRRLSAELQKRLSVSVIRDRDTLMEVLEQLESYRLEENNQGNEQNQRGDNHQRNHFNHQPQFRGRGGWHGPRNHGHGRQFYNDYGREDESRNHGREEDMRGNNGEGGMSAEN